MKRILAWSIAVHTFMYIFNIEIYFSIYILFSLSEFPVAKIHVQSQKVQYYRERNALSDWEESEIVVYHMQTNYHINEKLT